MDKFDKIAIGAVIVGLIMFGGGISMLHHISKKQQPCIQVHVTMEKK